MDASCGLILHPERGIRYVMAAGSSGAVEKPVSITPIPCRPGVSSTVFSTMLVLLETLRNLVVSGHEPAPYLISEDEGGRVLMTLEGRGNGYRVQRRAAGGGYRLEVTDETGQTGYRLEQFCRQLPNERLEAMPQAWTRLNTPALTANFGR